MLTSSFEKTGVNVWEVNIIWLTSVWKKKLMLNLHFKIYQTRALFCSRSLLLHLSSLFSVYLEVAHFKVNPSSSFISSKLEHHFRRTRASSQLSSSSPSPPYLGMFRIVLFEYLIAFIYCTPMYGSVKTLFLLYWLVQAHLCMEVA